MTHERWTELNVVRVNVPWLKVRDCGAARGLMGERRTL